VHPANILTTISNTRASASVFFIILPPLQKYLISPRYGNRFPYINFILS
jgi:hypothetical protein